LLSLVETSVARWCVLELNVDCAALKRLFPPRFSRRPPHVLDAHHLDGVVDRQAQGALWGRWAGREREFFLECGRLVSPLTWEEVTAIGGCEIEIHSRLVREAYSKLMAEETPSPLRVGTIQIIQMDAEYSSVSTYSPSDALVLPNALMDVLRQLKEKCTEEELQALAAQDGLQLDSGLVRRLADFRILVPAS
jgi:hypothetical protein